jgi:ligand-binding sensor domain-containing protein
MAWLLNHYAVKEASSMKIKEDKMKNSGSLAAIIAVSVLSFAIVIVGSVKKRPLIVENNAIANEFAQEEAAMNSDSFGDATLPEITTVLVDNNRLVIGTDNGLYLMPLSENATADGVVAPEQIETQPAFLCLNTILPLGESRFVGGYGLHKLNDSYTIAFESYYPGEIVYALMEFGDGLLVGTDRGLWYHCDEPIDENGCLDTLMLDNVIVTAIELDHTGLWVGTYGDGLFYNDGSAWQQRHLLRDTLSFAFVNAIEYRYPYLWVGTNNAIFRYDGGRWAQTFVADSSETHFVNAIKSTPAATYIGTEDGLLCWSDDALVTVPEYEGKAIAAIASDGKDVIVATRNDGIFTFKGKEEIVSPEQLTYRDYSATQTAGDPENIQDEVLAETDIEEIR